MFTEKAPKLSATCVTSLANIVDFWVVCMGKFKHDMS